MNKTELITQVAGKTGLKKSQASLAVDTLLESIQQALQNSDNVQLLGFGTFEVRERAAREGRNPRTESKYWRVSCHSREKSTCL